MGVVSGWQYGSETPPAVMIMNLMSSAGGSTHLKSLASRVKLQPGEARAVREKWARSQWTLYVDPKTYLPVRLSSSGRTYGGPAPSTYSTSVTEMQWLPPTAANIAKALITIPAGYTQVSSPAQQ